MSAAAVVDVLCASSSPEPVQKGGASGWQKAASPKPVPARRAAPSGQAPPISLAFYRKHTESTLRRYLYASLQVGRTPSMLGDPVGRGWVSSRTVRTFEDALIFVLDMERCLARLDSSDRLILSRVILQDYTHSEVAGMLGVATRTVGYKLAHALDRLTEKLVESDLLVIPG